jgi:hypothetical protein
MPIDTFTFADIAEEDLAALPLYVRVLIKNLKPIFQKIERTLLGENSIIAVVNYKSNAFLHIVIEPRNKEISNLQLFASKHSCSLGLFGGEYIESHGDPGVDSGNLINSLLSTTERYLEGFTIIEHYSKHNHLVRKVFYWGADAEQTKKNKIGISWHWFPLLWRTHHTEKKIVRFYK